MGPERFVGLALLAPCVYWVFWQALHQERKKSVSALSDFQEPKTSADYGPFARAEADLAEGIADLVAFGRPFVANPDLVERVRLGAPLAAVDAATLYTPGEKGYTDYPAWNGAAA